MVNRFGAFVVSAGLMASVPHVTHEPSLFSSKQSGSSSASIYGGPKGSLVGGKTLPPLLPSLVQGSERSIVSPQGLAGADTRVGSLVRGLFSGALPVVASLAENRVSFSMASPLFSSGGDVVGSLPVSSMGMAPMADPGFVTSFAQGAVPAQETQERIAEPILGGMVMGPLAEVVSQPTAPASVAASVDSGDQNNGILEGPARLSLQSRALAFSTSQPEVSPTAAPVSTASPARFLASRYPLPAQVSAEQKARLDERGRAILDALLGYTVISDEGAFIKNIRALGEQYFETFFGIFRVDDQDSQDSLFSQVMRFSGKKAVLFAKWVKHPMPHTVDKILRRKNLFANYPQDSLEASILKYIERGVRDTFFEAILQKLDNDEDAEGAVEKLRDKDTPAYGGGPGSPIRVVVPVPSTSSSLSQKPIVSEKAPKRAFASKILLPGQVSVEEKARLNGKGRAILNALLSHTAGSDQEAFRNNMRALGKQYFETLFDICKVGNTRSSLFSQVRGLFGIKVALFMGWVKDPEPSRTEAILLKQNLFANYPQDSLEAAILKYIEWFLHDTFLEAIVQKPIDKDTSVSGGVLSSSAGLIVPAPSASLSSTPTSAAAPGSEAMAASTLTWGGEESTEGGTDVQVSQTASEPTKEGTSSLKEETVGLIVPVSPASLSSTPTSAAAYRNEEIVISPVALVVAKKSPAVVSGVAPSSDVGSTRVSLLEAWKTMTAGPGFWQSPESNERYVAAGREETPFHLWIQSVFRYLWTAAVVLHLEKDKLELFHGLGSELLAELLEKFGEKEHSPAAASSSSSVSEDSPAFKYLRQAFNNLMKDEFINRVKPYAHNISEYIAYVREHAGEKDAFEKLMSVPPAFSLRVQTDPLAEEEEECDGFVVVRAAPPTEVSPLEASQQDDGFVVVSSEENMFVYRMDSLPLVVPRAVHGVSSSFSEEDDHDFSVDQQEKATSRLTVSPRRALVSSRRDDDDERKLT